MDEERAVTALGALAQRSRLEAFRLLVHAGGQGLRAGEIARSLSIPHNTLSVHLAVLAQGGLVVSHREGRSIIYRVDWEGVRAVLVFLMEDCCQGQPEVCEPLLAALQPDDAECS